MKKILQRGFTLIELLVVIAIIGILAAVVLASLNDARSGGKDASAKGSMTSVRNQAELFYNSNNYSYGEGDATVSAAGAVSHTDDDGVCAEEDVENLLSAAAEAAGQAGGCESTATAYAADIGLNNGTTFCVDSTGFAGSTTRSGTACE